MTRAHDEKVLDRIREIPALSESTFDGEVEGRPQRYVNVHSNRGIPTSDRFTQPAVRRLRKTYYVHAVGASKKQADAVAERVAEQLVGWTPGLDGWTCQRMTKASSQPTQKDETVKPPIYIAVDVYDLVSEPNDPNL